MAGAQQTKSDLLKNCQSALLHGPNDLNFLPVTDLENLVYTIRFKDYETRGLHKHYAQSIVDGRELAFVTQYDQPIVFRMNSRMLLPEYLKQVDLRAKSAPDVRPARLHVGMWTARIDLNLAKLLLSGALPFGKTFYGHEMKSRNTYAFTIPQWACE